MRIIEINGNNFNSLHGFFDEIEISLRDGKCPRTRTIASLRKIVSSCFNYTDRKSLNVSVIIWRNFIKSKIDLTKTKSGAVTMPALEKILSANPRIKFIKQ